MESGKVMQYGFLQDNSGYANAAGPLLSSSTGSNNPFVSGDLFKCEARKMVSPSGSSIGATVVKTGMDTGTCVTAVPDPRTDK